MPTHFGAKKSSIRGSVRGHNVILSTTVRIFASARIVVRSERRSNSKVSQTIISNNFIVKILDDRESDLKAKLLHA